MLPTLTKGRMLEEKKRRRGKKRGFSFVWVPMRTKTKMEVQAAQATVTYDTVTYDRRLHSPEGSSSGGNLLSPPPWCCKLQPAIFLKGNSDF